jgi:hypothetical protein
MKKDSGRFRLAERLYGASEAGGGRCSQDFRAKPRPAGAFAAGVILGHENETLKPLAGHGLVRTVVPTSSHGPSSWRPALRRAQIW